MCHVKLSLLNHPSFSLSVLTSFECFECIVINMSASMELGFRKNTGRQGLYSHFVMEIKQLSFDFVKAKRGST